MIIPRFIEKDLQKALVPGKAVLLMGARRVGKTTLLKKIQSEWKGTSRYFNCDDPQIREMLEDSTLEQLRELFQGIDLLLFDEAQRIKNVGLTLKLVVDEIPDKAVLVSGSSSFDLADEVTSPLTGRKKTFHLYPVSFLELHTYYRQDSVALRSTLDSFMRFGSYPMLFDIHDEKEKQEYLLELAQDYLFKDALEYQDIRNPEQLRKLLTALALQVGSEVSYTELASLVGIDQKTIVRYIDLLEKSYVIFRLPALSRNLRTEINKSRKIYFFDLGIRNALIRNFNAYEFRNDIGHVWENLMVIERVKRNVYKKDFKNYYFWRTYDQKEIDFIEESGGKLSGFEFKWDKNVITKAQTFLNIYPNSDLSLINKDSFVTFVT